MKFWTSRLLMGLGVLVAILSGYFVARSGFLPARGVMEGSVLSQPYGPVVGVAWALGVMVVGLVVGTLVAGRVRPAAGLFCGAIGWVGISWDSGALRQVLFAFPSAETFQKLAVETAILGALIGVAQLVISALTRKGVLGADHSRDGLETDEASLGEMVLAVLLTGAAYALLAWFLLPTDDKKQAICGVALAAFLATVLIHQLAVGTAPVWCYWTGIVIAAIGGFVYAATSSTGGLNGLISIGWAEVPLARALPLDHVGAGVAASVFGFWYSRRWKRTSEMEAKELEAMGLEGS